MANPDDGWTRSKTSPRMAGLVDWMLSTGPEDSDALVPLLVDIGASSVDEVATAMGETLEGVEPKARFVFPATPVPTGGLQTLLVRRSEIRALCSVRTGPLAGLRVVGHGPSLPHDATGTGTATALAALPDSEPAAGVVITAIIDIGLPILNAAFRTSQGLSRVRYAWVQDGKAAGGVPFGREHDAAALERIIAAHDVKGVGLDEVAAYRALGLMDFARASGHSLGRAFSHGAHVGALAAGYPPAENRTDRPVIAVQLPGAVVTDTSGTSLAPYLMAALDYVFDRSDRIAAALGCGRLPLVINFSFGGTGGPLDGTGAIERGIDARIEGRIAAGAPTAMVLPSGNAHLSDCHARIAAATGFSGRKRTETLHWRIQPADNTPSYLEIWLPKGPSGKRLAVALAPPGQRGPRSWLGEEQGQVLEYREGGVIVARLHYEYLGPPTSRGRFTAIVQPTARQDGLPGTAPAGVWPLWLRDTGLGAESHVDAWILRDDEMPGFDNDARQSRFIEIGPIVDEGLQNAIATGRMPVVAGGYEGRSGAVARYSAGGATNTPDRPGPDALALTDDSRVHYGVMSAAVLSGGRVARGGTSTAAPQLARKLADLMAAGFPADRQAVAELARQSERDDFAGRAPQPPIRRAGHGRIQIAPQNRRRYYPE